jgi:hypothetical protein
MFWVTFLAQKIDPILLEGFGKAKVDELQGMVAVVLVNLGFEVALAAIKRGNIYQKLSKYTLWLFNSLPWKITIFNR